ncbi:MAG: hypothetical protein U0271_44975 [Polyangiaceae bacterium]
MKALPEFDGASSMAEAAGLVAVALGEEPPRLCPWSESDDVTAGAVAARFESA